MLAAPAAYGSTALAFAAATAAFVALSAGLVALGAPAPLPDLRATGRRPGMIPGFMFAAAGGVLVFIACRAWLHQILVYPNDAQRADMLIVIQQGIRRMLQGRNPYTIYQVPWDATLPYGPVMWAPYIVPHLLRADVRFVSIWGALVLPVACAIAATGLASHGRRAQAAGLLLVAAALAFSPDLRGFASIAHTPSYWPLLGLLAWFVARERWPPAALVAGLLIVARTTMIAVAPVLLVAVWHRDRRRLPMVALLLASAAVLPYLPFAVWDGRALWFALYGSYQSLMKGFVWTQTTWARNTIGVTGLLLRAGGQRFAEAIQLLTMAAVYGFAWRAIRGGRPPLPWMAFALLTFSMTALWPVQYVYFDVLLLWAWAVVAHTGWPASSRVWPAWTISLAAAAVVLAGVVWLEVPRDPAIDVGTGAARPLLYRGFAANEGRDPTFAWIEGNRAEILVARRSRAGADLTIVCQPHLPTPGSTQQISVVLNGVVLGTATLRPGWQRVTFEAPKKAWLLGVNEVVVSASTSASPRETGTGDDARKLSVAIDALVVRTRVLAKEADVGRGPPSKG